MNMVFAGRKLPVEEKRHTNGYLKIRKHITAGVDNAWEQEKPEATLREMLDAKRAARQVHQERAGLIFHARNRRARWGEYTPKRQNKKPYQAVGAC